MSGELSGQVAIVTGGASGIGAASAAVLAEAGATVVVADLKTAEEGPRDKGGRFVRHDVTAEDSWQALLADVLKREGRLDVMVNNAGISGGAGSVESTDVETWQRVQAVNAEGVFLGCKYAIQGMKRTGPGKTQSKGSIVNISSVAGLQAGAGSIAYTASKGAVRLLSRSVALYCAEQKYDIRCNSVHPAAILTGIWEPMLGEGPDREAKMAALVADTPLKRFGTVEEVAALCVYLASADSAYMTGAELMLDGGLLAGSAASPG